VRRVVPREQAAEVAKIAHDIAGGDKAGRRKPADATVK
jgi:hypothetical protein